MPHSARGGTQCKGASRTGSARCEVRAHHGESWTGLALDWRGPVSEKIEGDERSPSLREGVISEIVRGDYLSKRWTSTIFARR
jgi:hypothetical protein